MTRALIIGGTNGLGRAIARRLIANGERVIIGGRNIDPCMEDRSLDGANLCRIDIAHPYGIEALFQEPHDWSDITRVFWTAGNFAEGPVTDMDAVTLRKLTDVHLTGLILNLTALHRMLQQARPLANEPGRTYHLVVVSSTSSWRVRDTEAVYGALCAAKSQFTRNFAKELFRDLPGSKATLVHPGGMNSPNFWSGTGRDTSSFMDPDKVAEIITRRAALQDASYEEYAIIRDPDGTPVVTPGAQKPTSPI